MNECIRRRMAVVDCNLRLDDGHDCCGDSWQKLSDVESCLNARKKTRGLVKDDSPTNTRSKTTYRCVRSQKGAIQATDRGVVGDSDRKCEDMSELKVQVLSVLLPAKHSLRCLCRPWKYCCGQTRQGD